MTSNTIIGLGGAVLTALAWIAYLAFTAPQGWEDRNGYHAGEPTEADLLSDYDND